MKSKFFNKAIAVLCCLFPFYVAVGASIGLPVLFNQSSFTRTVSKGTDPMLIVAMAIIGLFFSGLLIKDAFKKIEEEEKDENISSGPSIQ